MRVRSAFALATIALALLIGSPTLAQDQRLANYFFCELEEGRTMADLIAFKSEYEKAVAAAGLVGYELRVQVPMYSDDIRSGRFVWDGSWGTLEDMARISAWFRASDWPARFQEIMSCERSSLWRVID